MAEQNTPGIEVAAAKQVSVVVSGGLVNPYYGERRPMMYHLFETEMQSISAFNDEALRWFSIGTFFTSCVVSIGIGYGFASTPLSDLGRFMLYRASFFMGIIAASGFAWGIVAINRKKSIICRIKRETVSYQVTSQVMQPIPTLHEN